MEVAGSEVGNFLIGIDNYFKRSDIRPECQVLKCYKESGKFEKTFTIAKASDQQKLKKFIDFMGS